MIWTLSLLLTAGAFAAQEEPEAISLLGTALYRQEPAEATRVELEANLQAARAELEARPDDVSALIWVGRRTAYLGRYREAIEIYSEGLAALPSEARLLRHRGHRYISTRQLQKAVTDLERAADLVAGQANPVEPDGQPNRLNQPRGTLHFNIFYHLGLAHFLMGDFEQARRAYQRCLAVSDNDDVRVATLYWFVQTLWRLDENAEADRLLERVRPEMDIIENASYHRLLQLFKGDLQPADFRSGEDALQSATEGWGLASWHVSNGRREEGLALCRQVIESPQWSAFGYIACEAELARSR